MNDIENTWDKSLVEAVGKGDGTSLASTDFVFYFDTIVL